MSGNWKEVVRLRFTGDRFRDHALDLGALSELSQFQKIVAETAKALWRAANPGRERLPWHFEERTRLCLRRVEDGSAAAPLEVFIEEQEQGGLEQRTDKQYGLTDCISMCVMRAEGLEEALTNDHHFEQEGFQVLIRK